MSNEGEYMCEECSEDSYSNKGTNYECKLCEAGKYI